MMRRLGVLGTMVWDRIHARDVRAEPVEEWGGISYALAALAAARPAGWEILPIMKLGGDLEEPARRFLNTIPGLDPEPGLLVVPEPNNRVELRYTDGERRCERLAGGVPPWRWEELETVIRDLDALYINFISGFELDLETALRLRLAFDGPIYADLHSLLLGVAHGGYRVPRPLAAWRDWLRCFDVVQVNETELETLASAWGDPWLFAAEAVGPELKLLFVTLGPRGAAYLSAPGFSTDIRNWRTREPLLRRRPLAASGPALTERIGLEVGPLEGDPTGCGDVWGATCFAKLLEGEAVGEAVRQANSAAARNVEHRGATGLHLFLRGRIDA